MKDTTLFKLTLFSPFVLAALSLPFGIEALLIPIVWGGLPYIIFLMLFLWWARGKTMTELNMFFLFSPWFFSIFIFLYYVVASLINTSSPFEPFNRVHLVITGASVIVGYAYVLGIILLNAMLGALISEKET